MIWKYPQEFDDFIRANAPGHHDWELAEMARAAGWDVRENQVKCYRYNHKISNGFPTYCKKRKYWKIFSQEVADYLREIVNGRTADVLTEMINEKFGTEYTPNQIRGLKKNLHLRSNIDTRFLPGSTNKMAWFKKGTHPSPATEFKKGHACYNLAQVGDVKPRLDDRGKKILWIKTQASGNPFKDWMPYHRYVWEQHNGPIPKDLCIAFLDGDPMNCDISNLICVTRSSLTYVNKKKLHHADPAVMKTQYLTAMLHTTALRKRRENGEAESVQ